MKHYANHSPKGLMVIESNSKPWYISPNFHLFFLSIQNFTFYRCVWRGVSLGSDIIPRFKSINENKCGLCFCSGMAWALVINFKAVL